MKPKYLQKDALDDRREIFQLLGRLSPRGRVRFLEWACGQVVFPRSQTRPSVQRKTYELCERARWDDSLDERLTYECYLDYWMCHAVYGLDPDAATTKLVEMVRAENPGKRHLYTTG